MSAISVSACIEARIGVYGADQIFLQLSADAEKLTGYAERIDQGVDFACPSAQR